MLATSLIVFTLVAAAIMVFLANQQPSDKDR